MTACRSPLDAGMPVFETTAGGDVCMSVATKPAIRNAFMAGAVSLLALMSASGAWAQSAPAAEPAPIQTQTTAPAENTPAPALTGVVNRIIVRGNERIDASTITSYLPLRQGEVVDPARIDLAVKTLFRTDLFADVQISMQGADLIVQVVESPIINQVVFEGNKALTQDKLREEVSVRPRGIFTRSRVQQDVQRIIELYRRSGRISASVTPKIVQLPQKRIDLVFEIDEGVKTGINRIEFLGNRAYSDNDLKDIVVTKETEWWKFFGSNDNYDPDRIEYDREQLRKHYTNRGYYDFRVISSVAELLPSRDKFNVTYTVEEGVKYTFGTLKVETENAKLDPKTLEAMLPFKTGDLYESDKIEQAIDALTFAAGVAGFAFVDIRPRDVANPDTRTVDITFRVKEGPRVYVERIDIVGNIQTLDHVIRRELTLVEGDAYNRVLVDRSKNRVRGLGFFKDASIEELPGSAPDRTVLQVKVEEQPTGELSFGAGYSSVDKFILDLGITQRNFRGRGQNLRARLSFGSLRKNIDFSFTEPRFMGRNVSAGIDVYSNETSFRKYGGYDFNTKGFGLRAGYALNGYTLLRTRYNLRQDEIDYGNLCAGDNATAYYCLEQDQGLTSSVGYTLSFDRRNDPIKPTRGWAAIIRQDVAGLGGDVHYVQSELEGQWYYGFNPDFILSVSGTAGHIKGWSGDLVRANNRFYKGGNSFRGFENAGIGPRDTSNPNAYALGGNVYAIGAVELTVPNYLPEQYGIKTALFTEFGTLGVLDNRLKTTGVKDDLSLRASAGLSVRWKSPMGPIQFDFSKVLAKEDYDKTETFRFSTATQF